MSYSNGKLPEETISHGKIVEIVKGLPGVGFKLTDDGDYDIQNKKLRNVAEGTDNSDAVTKHQLETGLAPKADKTELASYLKKDGSIALTNNLDLGNNEIVNVKEATSGSHAVNLTQLNSELSKYLHKTGGDMTGDIRMNDNSIYEIKNVENDTSAVNRKYVNDELDKKLDNKITSLRNPDDSNELVNKSYVDQKVSQAGGSVDLTPYLKKDGSVALTGNLNMSQKRIINCGPPTNHFDVTRKSYVDNQFSRCLRLDGSNKMTGTLDMDNRRIENVGAGRHGTTDVLTHLQFEVFYFDLNTDSGNIEAQNPINMKNERILGVKDPILHSDASNKFYVDNSLNSKADKTQLSDKADKTELADYLKRDGSVSVTGNFDFGDNVITKVGNGSQSTDVVNKGYVDTELFAKPNVNQVVLRDGSQDVVGNLNMSLYKIIDCGQPTDTRDVTNKAYVDFEVGKKPDINQVILRDGSNTMTSNLDMNNQQIKNVKDATHNQDAITLKQVNDAIATTSTNNNKYTDQKIAESHISTHTNRKNVLKYAMDDREFTEDAGIQDVNLIDFNDMPHKTNKKAFSMKVQRTNDGSSEYKGRFDFNLFKLIRDNFSDHYTVCLETYFQKSPFYDYEFGSTVLSFEALNINIDTGLTVKVNSEYKYLRTILNLSPDGTSKQIQRRLYVNFKSNFDNSSPVLLPIFVLIYGIKDEAKNDLDMTIYDYELATQVTDNKFQLHIPINMNDNKITGLSAPTGDNDAVTKKYLTDSVLPSYIWGITSTNNASCDFLTPYGDVVLKIGEIFIDSIKIFSQSNYPIQSNHSLIIQTNVSSIYNINFAFNKTITVNINRFFRNINYIRINFSDRKKVIQIFNSIHDIFAMMIE